jgi:putative membrane protein
MRPINTIFLHTLLKGVLIGAANVVPGLSGGTMALLTGVFERLILAINALNIETFKLLSEKRFHLFLQRIDIQLLFPLGCGVLLSLFSLAKLLDYLFTVYPTNVWSFFFGLIIASAILVKKSIRQPSRVTRLFLLLGLFLAIGTSPLFLSPVSENNTIPYLVLCGVLAMCSMILPGLSGSYVLVLMGNYACVLRAVLTFDAAILLPFGLGAGIGLLLFARLLGWIFNHYHDQTIALLSGFIFGSLLTLWPWKTPILQTIITDEQLREKTIGYDYLLPSLSTSTMLTVLCMLLGAALVFVIEKQVKKSPPIESQETASE